MNRIREEGAGDAETLPGDGPRVLAARLDSLPPSSAGCSSTPRSSARPSGRARSADTAEEEGVELADALASLQDKDLVVSSAGSRLAGEHEYAFKHVLIRDVAYSTLPKSVRARKHAEVGAFIEERAATAPRAWSRWSPTTTARAAALGADAGLEPDRARARSRRARCAALEARRRRRRRALLQPGGARPLRDRARPRARARPGDPRADRREARRRGAPPRPRRPGDRGLGASASTTTAAQEDLERVGDLHRKIGAGLWHKGEREGSIEHYQKGIDLLKDGPPCLELVRLYEEAASLYMHTGDNMLAIYASEKALRLAERLGEAAAASRAHGIFGRVFGRIGDSEQGAREPRALGRARARVRPGRGGARPAHPRLPPRGLRGRLRRRREAYKEALDARRSRSATFPPRSSCTPRSPSSRSTAATGTRSRARPRRPRLWPSARD